MKMRRFFSLLTLILVSCTQSPAPDVGTPEPSFVPHGRADRVILISLDGLSADALARQSGLQSFQWLEQEGLSARVIPVNPTATSSTHVSLLTGADPQRTGIVSNRFQIRGATPDAVRGMLTEIEVETLTEAARRQGKRVGTASFPTVDNRSPRRSADFGFAWTEPLTAGEIVELNAPDFRREWLPAGWSRQPSSRRSYSAIMRARLEWGAPSGVQAAVDIVAYDTTNDGIENYDFFAVESGGREIEVDQHGWFAIARQGAEGLHGSWSRILRTRQDPAIRLYWGPIHRTDAWPREFQSMLDAEAGFWPGAPEEGVEVDAETFSDQMKRLAAFYTAAQTFALQRMEFDLLLLYQPQIDEMTHAFVGRGDQERHIAQAWEVSDQAIGSILRLLDPARDALIVTGDHGLNAVEREVRMNAFLRQYGYRSQWRAVTAGNVGHLYRLSDPDTSESLADLLLRSGYFEKVERKSAAHHRNNGDVIVTAWPQVSLSEGEESPILVAPSRAGEHGALNTHRELHPAFFAWGAGIQPGNAGEIRQTRIARFVAHLLGIEPPAAAE